MRLLHSATHAGRGLFVALALALMLVEFLFHRLNDDNAFDMRETAVSFVVAVGHKLTGVLTAGLLTAPMMAVYRHRLFTIPLNVVWTWAALFVAVEFCYYVHHVAMHRVAWFWATHAVHHSPTRLNLTAAVRLGWGGHLTGGFIFYLPLVLLGFHPFAVIGVLGLGLVYQFFLHQARPPHLGPFEWVLNTPRHHQVHHASNAGCLDRNFGAVLIVFDRLFGTFAEAPRDDPLRFGIAGTPATSNPLRVVLGPWLRMAGAVLHAKGVRAKARALLGPPG
jgi:sterol desaturase/sphingolipid hydroxylase (fatty acid hydroxylase superfamily)